MSEFKEGMVVQMKSGGPGMTVIRVGMPEIPSKANYIICQWYTGTKYETDSFPPEALEVVEQP